MSESLAVCRCGGLLQPDDAYCESCGCVTARIVWSFSTTLRPGEGGIAIQPGASFYLVAHNAGSPAAQVKVDTLKARGVALHGAPGARVEGRQSVAFVFSHLIGETPGGVLTVQSEDGPRPDGRPPANDWWTRRSWQAETLRISGRVALVQERWLIGSPVLVFPPGVREQVLRIWNDAGGERVFATESPNGYQLLNAFGLVPADLSPPKLAAGNTTELVVKALPERRARGADAEWFAGPDAETVPLLRLEASAVEAGADVVVAIDFGTRNTGIRVRWRRTLVAAKLKGTVDVIGDRDGHSRFPTEMALHRRERAFLWGSEVPAGALPPDMIRIENLKTLLRVGEEPYTQVNPHWTNAELLGRYFECIFARLDAYFETADPQIPLARQNVKIRYVMTRPVLDANTGDTQGQAYQGALLQALARCGVSEEAVTFVLEPEAAAVGIAKRREGELTALGEGAAIAVVDAGGGTTDIALAHVSLRDGQLKLAISRSFALHLDADNPAIPALKRYTLEDRLEFGGNVFDAALANRLRADAAALLDSDGRPVPTRLELSNPPPREEVETREREFIGVCRKMKETFTGSGQQYLSAAFPNRPEYEGVYLEHTFVDEHLMTPILEPLVAGLAEEMSEAAAAPGGIRAAQVRRVFYVGGTDVDVFVRGHFGQAFPTAPRDQSPDAQSPERIAERLNAVVEGAAWCGEPLFAAAPLDLTLRLAGSDTPLLRRGEPLSGGSSKITPYAVTLEPLEELDAQLFATGAGLPGSVCVARGFYRNTTDRPQEGALQIGLSRDKGLTAALVINHRTYEQWRLALAEAQA